MANKIQIRRDTAARWADVNPILSQGELGLDTTVGKLKIGNGVSTWAALSFYTGDTGPQGPAGVTSLSQLTNGSHVVKLGTDGKLILPNVNKIEVAANIQDATNVAVSTYEIVQGRYTLIVAKSTLTNANLFNVGSTVIGSDIGNGPFSSTITHPVYSFNTANWAIPVYAVGTGNVFGNFITLRNVNYGLTLSDTGQVTFPLVNNTQLFIQGNELGAPDFCGIGISANNAPVVINTYNPTLHAWEFGLNGTLTVPGNITRPLNQSLILNSGGNNNKTMAVIVDGSYGRLIVRSVGESSQYDWYFNSDGTTTFPTNVLATEINRNLTVRTSSATGSLVFERTINNGAYLETNNAINFANLSWSVEAYVNLQDTGMNALIGVGVTPGLNIMFNGTNFTVQSAYGLVNTWTNVIPTLNTWHHIAVAYNGEGINAWLNGTQLTGGQQTTTAVNGDYGNHTLFVGATPWTNAYGAAMKVSNLRVVTGSSLYDPNATTITVPTPQLSVVNGTKLLLLVNAESTMFTDASGLNTITNHGAAWGNASPITTVVANNWIFESNGSVTFPTLSVDLHNGGVQSGQVLKFSDPSKQVIITGPTPTDNASAQRIIIQGQRATGSGEGGDVYLWGGDSAVNGGDIKIYAGDADSTTSGNGGYVNIDGGNGYTSGGGVQITAGTGNLNGGYMNLSAGNGTVTGGSLNLFAGNGGTTPGNVYVNANSRRWTFSSDGSFTLPETSNSLTNVNQIISTRIYRPTTNNDTVAINTAKQMWIGSEAAWLEARYQDETLNGVRPWQNMPGWQAVDVINLFTATNGQTPGISQLAAMATTARNSYLTFKSLESNIDIVTGNKTFSFENTGNLTLPNDAKLIAGHPATGYVANTVSLSAENAYISDTTGSISFGVVNGSAKIKHGDNQWNFTVNGSTEFGGGWTFNNQYGTTQFPNNRLLVPADNSLDIKVVNNSGSSNAVLSLSNNYATWTFDKDKNFKLPNNAIIKPISSADTELQLATSNYTTSMSNWIAAQAIWIQQANNVGITSTGWPFIAWSPNGLSVTGYLSDLEAAWTAQNNPTSPPSPLVFVPPISQSLYTEIRSALTQIKTTFDSATALEVSLSISAGTSKLTVKGNGKLETPEIIQTVPEENLIIRTRFSVPSSPTGSSIVYTNKDFTFGTNGSLKFPDNTIQTTAYITNITSNTTNNSSVLAPGELMIRDYLKIRTVYTAPNSLNVEFYYEGPGVQITLSANNGTNIFAGTTVSYNIGWQRFNPGVFVNPGEKAEVVICDHSFHKIYRVTAMMRDIPAANDGSGSVYCVIEELK